ncbi:hypothetical protein B0T16DRAFT_421544 [Cercophora newfieldiana]|uniref:Uncharacterized protein n=1 Tax=Cercophora newfieldiana TaxID=92897 RepID=A0AA40CHP5_9PEZI|nr:hypothetical protein B0T16DRAFT_421544 [Cercophora newfieldiana]
MFEIPDAKRVRRQDLYNSLSSRSPSPDGDESNPNSAAQLRAKLNAQLSNLLAVNLTTDNDVDITVHEDGDEQPPADEEEFEFRLFSTSAPSQKIVLAADDVKHEGPALSQRPLSFYVRGELTEEEKERFRAAAVSAGGVIAEARRRAWGLEVPWRVTRIVVSMGRTKGGVGPQVKGGDEAKGEDGEKGKRNRPGKKRRIKLRIKEKAKKEEESKKLSKEEHLKEKKKRLNRERKLKRKQKEREQKAASKGGVEAKDGEEPPSEPDSE